MLDECPMIDECPGYDHDRRVCYFRSGDCEFAPPADEADAVVDPPDAKTAAASE